MASTAFRKPLTHLLHQRALIAALNRKQARNPLEQGFTLVELLIVVVILGVLSAVGVPALLNQQGRASINSAQTAAIEAARACASAAVTDNEGDFVLPTNITGTCNAAGTASTFTATAADFNVTTAPVATVSADGEVSLTTCAAANGWTAGTAPSCKPTKA